MKTQARIFLATLAGWMNRKQQDVIEYLLEENRVLKQQFDATDKKLALNDCQHRSLAEKAKKLGRDQLENYANLVTPKTLMDWHRRLIALKYTGKRMINTEGRKRMQVIRELCIKLTQENDDWGYGRIQGALANPGYDVCKATVGNILRKEGILPSPERANQTTWKRILRNHLSVISAADFFTTEVWTPHGLVRYLSFFVINIAKREVKIVHTSCQIDGKVMANLAREITNDFDGSLRGMEYLILDHFIFLGKNSLRKAIAEYMKHFYHERSHQGLDNLIPFPYSPAKPDQSSQIRKFERLEGLLNYYYRDNGKEELKAA